MKKILLGLGAIMTVAMPVAMGISCGSVAKKTIDHVNNDNSLNPKNVLDKSLISHGYEDVPYQELLDNAGDIINGHDNESIEDQASFIFGRFYQAWANQLWPENNHFSLLNTYCGINSSEAILLPTSFQDPKAIRGKYLKKDGKYFYKFKLAYNLEADTYNYNRAGTIKDENGNFIHAFWKYKDIPSVYPLTSETVKTLNEKFEPDSSKPSMQASLWNEYFPQLENIIQEDGSFIVSLNAFKDKHLCDNVMHVFSGSGIRRYPGRYSEYNLNDYSEDKIPEKIVYGKWTDQDWYDNYFFTWKTA